MSRPLVAITSRRLAVGRVARWPGAGTGEQQPYVDALQRAGADVVLIAPDATLDEQAAAALIRRFDAVVLTGGPDVGPHHYGQDPHASLYGVDDVVDSTELALTRALVDGAVPTLAICRGLQVLNVALGGTLHQHIPEDPGVAPHGTPGTGGNDERLHEITIDPGSGLAAAVGTTTVQGSCHHHQAIDRVAPGLRVVARAADGIVEAVELDGHPSWFLAVQWHPEDTAAHDPTQQRLFTALVREASIDLTS